MHRVLAHGVCSKQIAKYTKLLVRWGRNTSILSGICAVSLGAVSSYTEYPPEILLMHCVRFARAAYCVSMIAFDYKWHFRYLERGTNEYETMRTFINLKTGQRLLQLCQKNQATFIKVGQHIASLNQILPREITTALSVLQDKVEPRPYKDIAFIFQQELRKNPGQIFQYFEKEPVASASIAQVHKSVLLNGTKCAVKVQYPYIEYMIGGDLFTISILVHLMAAVFPNFSLTWILPQLNYVYEEIDFYREASNSKRAKANFKNYNNIYIPKVFDEYSTKKILVMEYMDGIKVNDIEALDQNHYNKFEIVSLINECINIQIFQHGFVHADPHPGNLMVCKENDKLKLIVLDHGLYKEIPRDVRLNYCHLLQSLLKKDKSATQYYSRQLGAGDLHELLAVMMLLRIKSDIRLNGTKFSQKDLEKLRNVFGNSFDQGFKSTNQLLESIPRELLYAFKASNLVRSIAFDLGIPISVKFADTVRHALNGIQAECTSNVIQNHQYCKPKSQTYF